MSDRRFIFMDIAHVHTCDRFDRHVGECRTDSDAQVVRYIRQRQSLGHKSTLACRYPVLAMRRTASDFYDVEQHVHRLDVAGVKPAKPVLPLECHNHSVDPERVVECGKATFLGGKYGVCIGFIKPLLRIALAADRSRYLRELLPRQAIRRRQPE